MAKRSTGTLAFSTRFGGNGGSRRDDAETPTSGQWLHPTAARRLRLVQPHLVTMTHSDHLLPLGTSVGPPHQWAGRQLIVHRTTFVRSGKTTCILMAAVNWSSRSAEKAGTGRPP